VPASDTILGLIRGLGGHEHGRSAAFDLTRLVAYVAVVITAGLLFLAGATVYELIGRGP
jgi:hypothetical protein